MSALLDRHAQAEEDVPTRAEDVGSVRAHVLQRIAATRPGTEPFRHLNIEQVLPDAFYEQLRAHMLAVKAGGRSDKSKSAPGRVSIMECDDPAVATFRAVFSDPSVIKALVAKFYIDPAAVMESGLTIHDRLEYTFVKAGRFQNIHVDIPPKYLSFVFYIPECTELTEEEELANATLLYDEKLQPRPCLRFRRNTVCVFAPHFRSYHGYASTRDREALVMFYSNPEELAKWKEVRLAQGDVAPFTAVRDWIEDKLRRHPLIELGRDQELLRREREACRVNGEQGFVLTDRR